MGEIDKYKCKNCGWETTAPPGGVDIYMDGDGEAAYICPVCKKVFHIGFSSEKPYIDNSREVCPICGSKDVFAWKPEDYCPNCGDQLEMVGLFCLTD